LVNPEGGYFEREYQGRFWFSRPGETQMALLFTNRSSAERYASDFTERIGQRIEVRETTRRTA
jgi:hypothetical protein